MSSSGLEASDRSMPTEASLVLEACGRVLPMVPMLGRLARELPVDGFWYEPKWDGFRCLAFCTSNV